MAGHITAAFVLFAVFFLSANVEDALASPAIATGYDSVGICIENCAQCKKMFGAWFEGPLCAESCIKFKGKLIPECEDFASISPFLNKL
nr:eclosion hormone precursor [Chilo suppressalis]